MTPLMCLAAAIFFEARDQPITGQLAVASVVLNRVESPRWPDNVCDVVFQTKQFSFTHDGKSDNYKKYASNKTEGQAIEVAETIAQEVLDGNRLGLTSTHYHTVNVNPFWAKLYHFDGRVGDHLFYTAPAHK